MGVAFEKKNPSDVCHTCIFVAVMFFSPLQIYLGLGGTILPFSTLTLVVLVDISPLSLLRYTHDISTTHRMRLHPVISKGYK